jgi:hypothetical protein
MHSSEKHCNLRFVVLILELFLQPKHGMDVWFLAILIAHHCGDGGSTPDGSSNIRIDLARIRQAGWVVK